MGGERADMQSDEVIYAGCGESGGE